MLKRLKIGHFKSIAEADVVLHAENVVVGQNGSGKSNLIDSIYFLRDAVRDDLETAVTKRHGIDSIRRWSKTRPYHISIHLFVENEKGHGDYRVVLSSANRNFSVHEEEANWWGQNPFDDNDKEETVAWFKRDSEGSIKFEVTPNPFKNMPAVRVNSSDLLLTHLTKGYISPLAFFLENLTKEVTSFSKYSIYPNTVRLPQTISTEDVLLDDGANLASIIKKMGVAGGRKNKEQLTSTLRQILPILLEIRVDSAGGYYVPLLRVREKLQPYAHDLNMSQLSDGTLRMLGLLTAFYQLRAPQKIAVEEPEQMVHPGLLPVLLDAARDYLSFNTNNQIFLTTHSPSLLDMIDAENIIRVDFEEGVSRIGPVSDRQKKLIQDHLFSPGELLVSEGII